MKNTEIINKFNNELTRLKNLGLEDFKSVEPVELKNPFPEGRIHDLWELTMDEEVEKMERLFEFDDFLRARDLTPIMKEGLDHLYLDSEQRKGVGIKTNVDYRNSLLSLVARIKELNSISEIRKQEIDWVKEIKEEELIRKYKRVKEVEERNQELEKENEELERENESAKLDAKTHFIAIKACEDWYTKNPGCLKEQQPW